MRLQAFSPALAFTSTALRTPHNNNNKAFAPTSSQRQGFDSDLYDLNQLPPLWCTPTRLPEMAEEINFFLECFEADWFKTFLSNRDPIPATEALQAKLSASQSSLSKNFRRSRGVISIAWQFFVDDLENRRGVKMETNPELIEMFISNMGPLDFDLEETKLDFMDILQQVQETIQQLKN